MGKAPGILIRFILAGLLLGAGMRLAVAQSGAPPGEYEVKAAFMYNFAKFVEWPTALGGEVRLCIFGRDPFGAALDALRGKPVKERRLEVAHIDSAAKLGECQIAYLSATLDKNLERIAEQARGKGVLLVSDSEGYAARGAMINLYLDDGKVRFEINHPAILASGLAVSSKLLSLGKLVK